MESKAVQMVCLALGTFGLIGVITCCALPEWLVVDSTYLDTECRYGLWMVCRWRHCRIYDSMERKPSDLQAFRAMTVISCILCGLSLCFLIYGADFTTCVQNQDAKTKRIQAAGLGLMLAGLLVIIPVSWWTHKIVKDEQCHSIDIGASIYIGWAAGMLMILTQCLLLSFGRPGAAGSSNSSGPTRTSSRTSSRTVSSGGVTATSFVAVVTEY